MATSLLHSGLHPKASSALEAVHIQGSRITQTIGGYIGSGGVHLAEPGADAPGRYWRINGLKYCAATDLSVLHPSQLSSSDILNLLERLARQGFAAWYRNPGHDGWPLHNRDGSPTARHIHIVYAGIPMKAALRDQIEQFLRGRNGLGGGPYSFHSFSSEAIAAVRQLFEAHDRGRLPLVALTNAEASTANFDGMPAYFQADWDVINKGSSEIEEVEDPGFTWVEDSDDTLQS